MIKRTPQEIADFFGCYVLMSVSGDWYITTEKPDKDTLNWKIQRYNRWHEIIDFMIDAPVDHDWTVLYSPNYGNEPHADNKGEAYYADQPESDNKHQYEVHTQKEYKVVCYTYENSLNEAITSMMSEGWKPQGSIAMVYLGEIYSPPIMFAQAMVRGV